MMKDTLRILYLTTFYPTEENSHHGIFFRDHAEALATKHDVTVLNCEVLSWKEDFLLKTRLHESTINKVLTIHSTHFVPSHRVQSWVNKAYLKAANQGMFHAMKRKNSFDLIIAQCSLPAGLLAFEMSKQWHVPYGIIEHFSFLEEQVKTQKEEMSSVYKTSKFIATVSEKHIPIIKNQFKKEAIKIDNVISGDFKNIPNSPKAKGQPLKWLYIGYNNHKKGPDLLREVLNLNPDLNITIVGKGLDEIAKNHDLATHYESRKREEVINLMSSHDVLLSTSRTETFGMAIVEALSSGLPVVATKSGGPNQYLDSDLGILSEINVESICEAIKKMEQDFFTFDQNHIKNKIFNRFGPTNYINQIESIFNTIE